MNNSDQDRSILKTIDRALELLLAFSIDRPEWGVTELSQHFGWDKSVTQRMLSTLEARSFIIQNQQNKKYKLGYAILRLSEVISRSFDIVDVTKDTMKKLVDETKESVILTIPNGKGSICISSMEGPSSVRYSTSLGTHTPLHVGAGSKALFAFADDEELSALLHHYEFIRFTPQTITDKQQLLNEFKEIKESGIAKSFGERDTGVGAVGIPLRNYRNDVVAAISIVGPLERVLDKLTELEVILLVVGKELSSKLGARV